MVGYNPDPRRILPGRSLVPVASRRRWRAPAILGFLLGLGHGRLL
jgi:hypothetical protein